MFQYPEASLPTPAVPAGVPTDPLLPRPLLPPVIAENPQPDVVLIRDPGPAVPPVVGLKPTPPAPPVTAVVAFLPPVPPLAPPPPP